MSRKGLRLVQALAVVLLLRALVPAGWMPVAQAGTIGLMPCPSWWPASPSAPARVAEPSKLLVAHAADHSGGHKASHGGHGGHDAGHSHHATLDHHAAHQAAAPFHDVADDVADAAQADHDGHDESRMDQPCVFAGLSSVATAEGFLLPDPPPPPDAAVAPQPVRATPGLGLAAPPPPSTGPPILN